MEPMPEDWERAVAVVAHPDDLEYGMASAVARFTAQGKKLSYVLATSGEAGIDSMTPERCGPLREEEQRRSAAVVGVDHVEFLGHPDGSVEYGLALRRDLAGAIRRLRPQIVFGMNFELTWGESGGVNHADHRAVGLATLDACRDAANRWMFPGAGRSLAGHHWRIRRREQHSHSLRGRDRDNLRRGGVPGPASCLHRGLGHRLRSRSLPPGHGRLRRHGGRLRVRRPPPAVPSLTVKRTLGTSVTSRSADLGWRAPRSAVWDDL